MKIVMAAPKHSPLDLYQEKYRLSTFTSDWPHAYISPNILAKTGFYFIGPYDRVMCHFCKVEVNAWEMGDNEVTEHVRWSIDCPLLQQRKTDNVPLEPISDYMKLIAPIRESRDQTRRYIMGALVETPMSFFRKDPDFPEFKSHLTRLETFTEWPNPKIQCPNQLSEAGFFYTQKEDRVICFNCGGGLFKWDEQDDPWEMHAWWYEECSYLRRKKGINYIKSVQLKFKNQ